MQKALVMRASTESDAPAPESVAPPCVFVSGTSEAANKVSAVLAVGSEDMDCACDAPQPDNSTANATMQGNINVRWQQSNFEVVLMALNS